MSRRVTLSITVTQEPHEKAEPANDENEPTGAERKERVIHTRVPALLEQELKRMAQSLRVPVSNVVRAILEDAVDAVDRVGRKAEGEVRGLAELLAHNRDRLREVARRRGAADASSDEAEARDEPGARARGTTARTQGSPPAGATSPLAGVIGYQPLELAVAAECAVCGKALDAGEQAFVGVRAVDGPRVLIGPECLPARQRQRS